MTTFAPKYSNDKAYQNCLIQSNNYKNQNAIDLVLKQFISFLMAFLIRHQIRPTSLHKDDFLPTFPLGTSSLKLPVIFTKQ